MHSIKTVVVLKEAKTMIPYYLTPEEGGDTLSNSGVVPSSVQ